MTDWAAFDELLPENPAMPVCGLRAVLYINEDGSQDYGFQWLGEAEYSTTFGLLTLIELATREMMREDVE